MMKPIVLSTALVLLCAVSLAQITITTDDLPQEGELITVSQSVILDGFDGDDTGMDYQWDYSDLEATSTADIYFAPVGETPFLYQFFFNNPFDPDYEADFGQAFDDINLFDVITFDDIYAYYKNTDTAYWQVGYAATINDLPVPSKNEPRDLIFNLPMHFTDSDSSYTENLMEVPTVLTYKLKQSRNYVVDGWGSVTTPLGTYDALRVKMEIEAVDSVVFPAFFIDFEIPRPLTTEYLWYAEGQSVPVLRIVESLGFVAQVEFKDTAIVTSIDEPGDFDIQLYPNPCTDYFQIEHGPDVASVVVIDNAGRLVKSYPANVTQFDTTDLPSGGYLIVLENRKGEFTTRNLQVRR